MEPGPSRGTGDLEARLRNIRIGSTANVPLAAVPATMPRDALQEKVDQYLATIVKMPDFRDEFRGLGDIFGALRAVHHDFPDNFLLNKPGISMDRYNDDYIARLGRSVIPMLASGFSRSGVASVFVLAYHLRKPVSRYAEYVFDGMGDLAVLEDKKPEDYPDKVIDAVGRAQPIIPIGDSKKEAAVYAYIAASLLRLFRKSASNYVKAWGHIVEGFSKFYRDSVEVMLPRPSEKALERLALLFSIDPRVKVALFRILYISNGDSSHLGLKGFLYDRHISNTGLHIVDMVVALAEVLNCSPGLILAAIDPKENFREVKCLVHVVLLLQDTGDNHARKMWRYGRIFDEAFMSDLQTKKCPNLVYLLASALQQEAPEANKDILQIAQLANVGVENRGSAKASAQVLLSVIKRHTQPRRSPDVPEGSN